MFTLKLLPRLAVNHQTSDHTQIPAENNSVKRLENGFLPNCNESRLGVS